MLRQREHVPIRILEPRNAVSAGEGADRIVIVRHSGISLEDDAALLQSRDRTNDVLHFPSQNGVLSWSKLAHLAHTQHGSMRVKNKREPIISDKGEAELVAVKRLAFLRLRRNREANEF